MTLQEILKLQNLSDKQIEEVMSEMEQNKIYLADDTRVAKLQSELEKTKVESAIKVALYSAKAKDVDYLTFKLKEKGEIKLDDRGEVKGIDDILAGLKMQFPAQFEIDAQKRINEHKLPYNDNTKKIGPEEFNKMGYQDRLKVYNDNPELYAELSGNKTN